VLQTSLADLSISDPHYHERLLHAVVNNATLALFIMDERQHCVYMNGAAEKLTRYTLAEVRGRPLHEVIHHTRPDGRHYPLEESPIDRAFPQNNQEQGREVFVHKDGSFYPVEFTASPVREAGVVVGTVIEVRDLSQIERLEAQRSEMEEQLAYQAQLLDITHEAVIAFDAEERITFWNPGAERTYGWTAEQTLGKTAAEIFRLVDERDERGRARRREILLRGDTLSQEIALRRKDGLTLSIEFNARALFDHEGRLAGYVAVHHDVTERKRAEAALRESEERFRTLADNIAQFAWMADEQGWIFWYNRRWFEYTGTSLEEMQGWGWQKVHHPEHVGRVVEKIRYSFATGEAWEDTFPLRGKDGQYRWFLSRAIPIRDADGKVLRWFGTNTDITEQRQAEQAVRESEARLRALVEASPLGIDIMDLDGNPVFYNPKCEELHGIGLNEAGGAGWTETLHPDDRERIAASWYEAAKARRPWAETYRFVHRDGRVVWLSGRAAPMSIGGQPVGFVGTLEDITDLKLAEQALRESEAQFHTLANSIPQLAWIADAEGSVYWYNQRWYDYTGTSLEEMKRLG
jgi:PAS domain S-box-containing protein